MPEVDVIRAQLFALQPPDAHSAAGNGDRGAGAAAA